MFMFYALSVILIIRGVAQPGSALGSGPRGREFKSPLPDHFFRKDFKQLR